MLGKIVVVYASRFQLLLVLSQTPSFGGQFPYLHCRYLRSGKPPPPPTSHPASRFLFLVFAWHPEANAL
jgi:hypothetical protein